VSELLLGQFIEHLGMCIENGIWYYKNKDAPMLEPPLDRVRKELFEKIRDLGPTIIRYPGGCFSDTYHWKDGIGPREKRPIRKNKAWGGIKSIFGLLEYYNIGPKERNHFGTDEFLVLCEKLGVKKYINVNFGSGTPQEAAEWVEYTNGSENTKYGKLRSDYGHKNPYNVEYWGIGNEIFGWWEVGHCKTAVEYVEKYLEFAKAMKKVDKNIKLVGVGWKSDWNRAFLSKTRGWVDILSIHIYLPAVNLLKYLIYSSPLPQNEKVYYAILNSVQMVDDLLTNTEKDITSVFGDTGYKNVKIALDEYNIWYRWKQIYRADRPHYTLRDGLWTACVLNTLIKHAKFVEMANFAQMVNTLGAIITYDDKIIVNPHYYALKIFSDSWPSEAHLLNLEVECKDIISEDFANIPIIKRPILDTSALISKDDKQLALFIVNKHFMEPIEIDIKIDSGLNFRPKKEVYCKLLTHNNPFAINTRKNPDEIKIKEFTLDYNGGIIYKSPAHSLTALIFNSV